MVRLSNGKRKVIKLPEKKEDPVKARNEMIKNLIAKTGITKVGEDGEYTDKQGHKYVIQWRRTSETTELKGDDILKMFGITEQSLAKMKASRKKADEAIQAGTPETVPLEPVTVTNSAGEEQTVVPGDVKGAE